MYKRIAVVTGCAVFIGTTFTRLLLEKGWLVYGIDKFTYAANEQEMAWLLNTYPDNYIVIKNDIKYGGVVRTPLSEFKKKYNKTIIREIDGDIQIARNKVGKVMYDIDGLIGAWFRINIQNPKEYLCTELLADCIDSFDKEFSHKSQPIWFLAFSKPIG